MLKLNGAMNRIAQINGRLEKFQYGKVDAIITGKEKEITEV